MCENKSNFDDKYMSIAKIWARNSHAIKHKVGAIVVKDNCIISDGYNGTPKGFDNCCEYINCTDCSGECNIQVGDVKCYDCAYGELKTKPMVIHAEANAITKLAKGTQSSIGSTMYVTLSPCCECAKLIIQSGIRRVIYEEEYRNNEGIKLLKDAGIIVEQLNKQ